MTTPPPSDPRERTLLWLHEAVIGLDLCPFAAAPWREGLVRVVVSEATDDDGAVRDALAEAQHLVDSRADVLATTLVVFPRALADFEAFLDAADAVEALLEEAGALSHVQVATFHPAYRFEGAAEDDPGNFTNRSPFPTLHLLRAEEVERAVATHPDTLAIPDANVARLRGLPPASLAGLWRRWQAG